jgi:hypothetical protein
MVMAWSHYIDIQCFWNSVNVLLTWPHSFIILRLIQCHILLCLFYWWNECYSSNWATSNRSIVVSSGTYNDVHLLEVWSRVILSRKVHYTEYVLSSMNQFIHPHIITIEYNEKAHNIHYVHCKSHSVSGFQKRDFTVGIQLSHRKWSSTTLNRHLPFCTQLNPPLLSPW